MRVKVTVTFEFDSYPPQTYRAVVDAKQFATAARKAVTAAKTALRTKQPRSIVVVVETGAEAAA